MSGIVVKEKGYCNLTYVEAGVPEVKYVSCSVIYTHGIVVGKRTIQDGEWDFEDGYCIYNPVAESARTVWLVAYDLHRKPVMCLDSQVESVGHVVA